MGDVVAALSELRTFIQQHEYGNDVLGISIVLMCRDPALHFRRRIRLSRREKQLSFDIMLDLGQLQSANATQRRAIVAARFSAELPEILSRYKFDDLASEKLGKDVTSWFRNEGWLNEHSLQPAAN